MPALSVLIALSGAQRFGLAWLMEVGMELHFVVNVVCQSITSYSNGSILALRFTTWIRAELGDNFMSNGKGIIS